MKRITAIAVTALALSACDSFNHKDDPQPAFGNLTQHMSMIGADGRNYGTVEFDPVGQGKIYDTTGKIVGRIVPPQ